MKKVGDIMKELGFNPESSVGAQEAFVKNLIRDAYGVEVKTPTEKRMAKDRARALGRELGSETRSPKTKDEQLSFDLRDLVPADELPVNKKKSVG